MLGIEWLKPARLLRLDPVRADRRADLLAQLRDHRQAHALQPVAGARREAERGARPSWSAAMSLGICDHRGGRVVALSCDGLDRARPAPGRAVAAPGRDRAARLRLRGRGLRAGLRADRRRAGSLPARRLGAAVLHHHRHLPVRDGGGLLALALFRAPAAGALPAHRTAGGADRRRAAGAAVHRQRLRAGRLPPAALRAGAGGRHRWSGWRSRW